MISEEEVVEREEAVGSATGATPGQVAVEVPQDGSAVGSKHSVSPPTSFRVGKVSLSSERRTWRVCDLKSVLLSRRAVSLCFSASNPIMIVSNPIMIDLHMSWDGIHGTCASVEATRVCQT